MSHIEAEVKNIVELSKMAPNKLVLETASGLLNDLERKRIKFENMRSMLLNIEERKNKEALALAQFAQKCATWRKRLKTKNAKFSYAEMREAIEYFGVKARVWRHDSTMRYQIKAKPPVIASIEL